MFTTYKKWAIIGALVVLVALACAKSLNTNRIVNPQSDQFAAQNEMANRYERWIATMDPFVTTNSNGTFTINIDGFLNSIQATEPTVVQHFRSGIVSTGDDSTIVNLNSGIPIINKSILEGNGTPTIAGSACWWLWWGRKCCFWGNDAQIQIQNLNDFGLLPIFGFVGSGLASWANRIYILHNGFCCSQTWLGVLWLSAP